MQNYQNLAKPPTALGVREYLKHFAIYSRSSSKFIPIFLSANIQACILTWIKLTIQMFTIFSLFIIIHQILYSDKPAHVYFQLF